MSNYLIDPPRGGGGGLFPAIILEYNTEAATPGNTTVALRLAAPVPCFVDWGDGDAFDQVRSIDYVLEAGPQTYAYTRNYAVPGIYTALVYTIGFARIQLRSERPGWYFAVSAKTPPNLITYAEFLEQGRYTGYSGLFRDCLYLDQVVFPIGEGLGSKGLGLNGAFERTKITSFPRCNFTQPGVNLETVFYQNTFLASVANLAAADTSKIAFLRNAFKGCTGLASFPAINLTGVDGSTNCFDDTWAGCTGLTSFGLCVMPPATTIQRLRGTWGGCTGLTSFPSMYFGRVREFDYAWNGCTGFVSFPAIDTTSAISFSNTWQNCISLTTFPPNVFNGCSATDFIDAFTNCALTATSVNNILVSIESNGTSNGILNISGGTNAAPTGAGATAKTALQARGWTVITN